MESHLIGLLLLLPRLQQVSQPLGRETILPFAEIKLPQVARTYDALVLSLQEKNLIEGDPEQFTLCQSGLDLVKELSQRYSLHAWFYNEYYQAILHSQAHALFCERLYGKDLGQHGMADMEQIHLLISQLEIRPGMTPLDFGCGDGQITEYIADVTQATAIGIDIADDAIRLAECNGLENFHRYLYGVPAA